MALCSKLITLQNLDNVTAISGRHCWSNRALYGRKTVTLTIRQDINKRSLQDVLVCKSPGDRVSGVCYNRYQSRNRRVSCQIELDSPRRRNDMNSNEMKTLTPGDNKGGYDGVYSKDDGDCLPISTRTAPRNGFS